MSIFQTSLEKKERKEEKKKKRKEDREKQKGYKYVLVWHIGLEEVLDFKECERRESGLEVLWNFDVLKESLANDKHSRRVLIR